MSENSDRKRSGRPKSSAEPEDTFLRGNGCMINGSQDNSWMVVVEF